VRGSNAATEETLAFNEETVTRDGEVGAGDEIKVIARDPNAVPVSKITRLYVAKRYGDEKLTSVRLVLRVSALPESWKEHFRRRLHEAI
jgi:MOSC domain-containing protein YiiM